MSTEDTSKQLENAMLQPKKVVIDDKTVEQHSLDEVIAMDRYVQSKKALRKRTLGIRFGKMSAGGAS